MNGRTHFMIGIATGSALVAYLRPDLPVAAIMVAAASVGSLLPDVDHPQSIISGWLPGAGLLRLGVRHRGLTHSILFIMLCSLGGLTLVLAATGGRLTDGNELWVLGAFLAGVGTHLLLDMVTPEGVQLFYPSGRFWRIPLVSIIPVWIWEGVYTTWALVVIALSLVGLLRG